MHSDFAQVEEEFEAQELGVWVHLWENPQNEGEDYLLILSKSPRISLNGYGPVNQSHEDYINNMLETILTDYISTTPFENKGERLVYTLFDVLWQGFPTYILEQDEDPPCGLKVSFKSAAPTNQNIMGISDFIGLMEEIEDDIAINHPEEVRNTKLMITRFRRIFYNSDGWHTYIIPDAYSPESQSPFGAPCSQERERITVDGTWYNFDYVDTEVYPCLPGSGERPLIYLNQEVKLEEGSSSNLFIDIGHVFAGLDAHNFSGSVGIEIPLFGYLGVERNVDAATWVGDLGSVITFAKIDYINGGKEPMSNCDFQSHIDKGAPPQDMLGNIDAFVIAENYPINSTENGPKVSEIFKNYYLGVASELLPFDGLQLYQKFRFSSFANSIGLIVDNGNFLNEEIVILNYQDQIADIAGIILAKDGEGFLDIPTSFPFAFGITRDKASGRVLMELMLEELSNCINTEP